MAKQPKKNYLKIIGRKYSNYSKQGYINKHKNNLTRNIHL